MKARLMTVITVLLILLLLPLGVRGQEECPASTLNAAIETNLRNRNDRVEDLIELVGEINQAGFSEDGIYELLYWSAMAESAAVRFGDEIPDCGAYALMAETFANIYEGVYAISGQALVLNRLENEFQQQNVADLLENRIQALALNVELWNGYYQDIQ